MNPRNAFIAIITATVLPLAAQQAPPVLTIGAPAPAFSLPAADGKTYSLADFKEAKVLCVVFTSNHCPDSVGAAPRMEPTHQAYKDKGVAFIAVGANNPLCLTPDELGYSPYGDSFEEMSPFAKDYGWTFPYLYDGEKQEFATACGAQSTPHVFVFDQDRKLRYTGRMDDGRRNPGPVEKSQLRDALDALLAGKEITEPVTRSFGCSTKWLHKKASVAADQAAWLKKPVTIEDMDEALAKKLRANPTKKLRLINFWSTTCGPCVKEFPDLVDTSRRFQNRNLEFVSISVDPADGREKVSEFLETHHAAIPDPISPSLAEEGRTSNNYHWTGGNPDVMAEALDDKWTGALPHSLLIAPGGEILWRHTGEVNVVEMRKEILKGLK
jgi:peroxiredoxin